MTRTAGRIGAIELKVSPTHTARSVQVLAHRLEAFVGPIGRGQPDDEPDCFLVDGHEVSGAEMWRAARLNPTVSVPRPPVVARFVCADPVWGPRLAELRQEAVLHQLQTDVSDLKRNLPSPAIAVPPRGRRGGRKHQDVDALLGRVEAKIIAAMKRQRATEVEIQNALCTKLYSHYSSDLAKIIKDELRVSISERTIRRTSKKYAAWARHRTPTAAPSVDSDVGPAYSAEDDEPAAKSATGQTVAASRADTARQSLLEGELKEVRRGGRSCRVNKTAKERQHDQVVDAFFRDAGLNPADFRAD